VSDRHASLCHLTSMLSTCWLLLRSLKSSVVKITLTQTMLRQHTHRDCHAHVSGIFPKQGQLVMSTNTEKHTAIISKLYRSALDKIHDVMRHYEALSGIMAKVSGT
jgi:hypothetical protein